MSLKASELRIGNWFTPVMDDGTALTNRPIIAAEFMAVFNKPEKGLPIPLTEEWLLKFGFEYTDGEDAYECIWSLSGVEVWQHDKGFCHSYVFGGDVEYVHQIQNLYSALTGMELEITA